jgi:hypothetical protein
MEAREEKQKALAANTQANPNEKTNSVGRIPSTRVGMGFLEGSARRESNAARVFVGANDSTAKSRPF